MNNPYTTVFALLKKMPGVTKEEAVHDFTKGRTRSLRALTDMEVRELIKAMQIRLGQTNHQTPTLHKANNERRPMRGKIIHYMCLMGYTKPNGTADFDRIDNFIMGMGSNNPRKVILNYLYKNELLKVLTQVEEIYRKELIKTK